MLSTLWAVPASAPEPFLNEVVGICFHSVKNFSSIIRTAPIPTSHIIRKSMCSPLKLPQTDQHTAQFESLASKVAFLRKDYDMDLGENRICWREHL